MKLFTRKNKSRLHLIYNGETREFYPSYFGKYDKYGRKIEEDKYYWNTDQLSSSIRYHYNTNGSSSMTTTLYAKDGEVDRLYGLDIVKNRFKFSRAEHTGESTIMVDYKINSKSTIQDISIINSEYSVHKSSILGDSDEVWTTTIYDDDLRIIYNSNTTSNHGMKTSEHIFTIISKDGTIDTLDNRRTINTDHDISEDDNPHSIKNAVRYEIIEENTNDHITRYKYYDCEDRIVYEIHSEDQKPFYACNIEYIDCNPYFGRIETNMHYILGMIEQSITLTDKTGNKINYSNVVECMVEDKDRIYTMNINDIWSYGLTFNSTSKRIALKNDMTDIDISYDGDECYKTTTIYNKHHHKIKQIKEEWKTSSAIYSSNIYDIYYRPFIGTRKMRVRYELVNDYDETHESGIIYRWYYDIFGRIKSKYNYNMHSYTPNVPITKTIYKYGLNPFNRNDKESRLYINVHGLWKNSAIFVNNHGVQYSISFDDETGKITDATYSHITYHMWKLNTIVLSKWLKYIEKIITACGNGYIKLESNDVY